MIKMLKDKTHERISTETEAILKNKSYTFYFYSSGYFLKSLRPFLMFIVFLSFLLISLFGLIVWPVCQPTFYFFGTSLSR